MKKFKYLGLFLAVVLTASLAWAGATHQKDDMDFGGNVVFTGEVPNFTGHPVVKVTLPYNNSYATTSVDGTTVIDIAGSSLTIPRLTFDSGESIEWEVHGNLTKYGTTTAYLMIYMIDQPMVTATIHSSSSGEFLANCILTAASSSRSHASCVVNANLSSTPYSLGAVLTTTRMFQSISKDLSAGGDFKLQMNHNAAVSSSTIDYVRVKYNN